MHLGRNRPSVQKRCSFGQPIWCIGVGFAIRGILVYFLLALDGWHSSSGLIKTWVATFRICIHVETNIWGAIIWKGVLKSLRFVRAPKDSQINRTTFCIETSLRRMGNDFIHKQLFSNRLTWKVDGTLNIRPRVVTYQHIDCRIVCMQITDTT